MCCSRRTCKHYKEIFCDGVSIYKISVLERYLIGEFVDTFFSFPSADNIQTADVNGATGSNMQQHRDRTIRSEQRQTNQRSL